MRTLRRAFQHPGLTRLLAAGAGLFAALLLAGLTACNNSSETPETSAAIAPFHVHQVYDPQANASAVIADALAEASRQHKRVLLDFGGNWCGDCQVLDYYLHLPGNIELLTHYYVLVDIDIGEYNRNLDLANKYGIPLSKGVPALAVLNANGRLLYSQMNGQFEKMSRMNPASVTRFLERWKGSGG